MRDPESCNTVSGQVPRKEKAVSGNVATEAERQPWEQPKLTFEGNVEELVLAIIGKISVTPGDAQENRKVSGL